MVPESCRSRRLIQKTFLGVGMALLAGNLSGAETSDPAHVDGQSARPLPWPNGIIPYDISNLTEAQQVIAKRGMQHWLDTGARLSFIPRTTESEYVLFTGKTNAGNNTSHVGYIPGLRAEINITTFWWAQGEWMPAHELGHVLGFFHEHSRWDRDAYVTIHYENIKPGREGDYNWVPKTNWINSSTAYDYRSIMHYRVCWTGHCESECKDGNGAGPCAVIDPVGSEYDRVIGQWTENGLSKVDAQEARLVYGTNSSAKPAVSLGP